MCVEPFGHGGDLSACVLSYFGHGGNFSACVLRDEPFGHGVDFSACVLYVEPFEHGSDLLACNYCTAWYVEPLGMDVIS